MTSIELPDSTNPQRAALPSRRRPAPCAGLFGWRKDIDGAPPPAKSHDATDSERRYSVG